MTISWGTLGIEWGEQYVESSFHGSNKDYHIAYYGEIVSAYIIG